MNTSAETQQKILYIIMRMMNTIMRNTELEALCYTFFPFSSFIITGYPIF